MGEADKDRMDPVKEFTSQIRLSQMSAALSRLEVFYKVYQVETSKSTYEELEKGEGKLMKYTDEDTSKRKAVKISTESMQFSDELWRQQSNILSILPSHHVVRCTLTNFGIWKQICEVSDEGRNYLKDMKVAESPSVLEQNILLEQNMPQSERNYLEAEIFPLLLPALEQMLHKAQEWQCLEVQKCKFNGLDYLAEILWNRNPRHHGRAQRWKNIFNIPFVKEWLQEHPRPFYPMSWLLTQDEAALIIQSAVRGYLVRRQPDVQEMRQFWRVLEADRKEEERRKREEEERWHMILMEEEKQRKTEEAERVKERLEILRQEEEAAMKSRAEQFKIKKQQKEELVKDVQEGIEEVLTTVYETASYSSDRHSKESIASILRKQLNSLLTSTSKQSIISTGSHLISPSLQTIHKIDSEPLKKVVKRKSDNKP